MNLIQFLNVKDVLYIVTENRSLSNLDVLKNRTPGFISCENVLHQGTIPIIFGTMRVQNIRGKRG